MVIRCYQPGDAKMVLQAISNSLDELKQWMPWAQNEPSSLASKKALLKTFESDFIQGIDHTFGLFNKQQDVLIGSSGLHSRIGPKAREIGYWINTNYYNQGYATESTRALVKVGFEHLELEHIEIHCDPRNMASQQIPKKLAFDLAEILRDNTTSPEGSPRDTMIWRLSDKKFRETRDLYPKIEVKFQKTTI